MTEQNTTLRVLLSQAKPEIRCKSTATRNTAYENWKKFNNSVAIWHEFTLANLNESYGHVLDKVFRESLLVCPQADQELAGVVVDTTEDINLLISWNDGLMKSTLDLAKSLLGLHSCVRLRHSYSTPDKTTLANWPEMPKGRLGLDHVISIDDYPGANLIVGLARESSKWSGRRLLAQLKNPSQELFWPLRQLGNLCNLAGTRYGYIQTDEEMVVCCFSQSVTGLKAAIMPVPWTKSGPKVLTTDLALWWLCMLAMSGPHHRAIVGEGQMDKIDAWDIVQGGSSRCHRYSKRHLPLMPPPAVESTIFSPGNASTGVALDTNDWLNMDLTVEGSMANFGDFNFTNFSPAGFNAFDMNSFGTNPADIN